MAALLSAASFIGGIGLTLSSGWLITMAAQQPPILTLTVAIVGVRFFGISRSIFRYAERLMSHSAVFSSLTHVRARLFAAVATTPVTAMRSLVQGNLTKKIVDDVERSQEFQLREVLPKKSALISILFGTFAGVWISPASVYFTLPTLFIFIFFIPYMYRRSVITSSYRVEDNESELADLFSLSQAELKEAEIFGYLTTIKDEREEKIDVIAKGEGKVLRSISALQALTLLTLGGALISSIAIATSLQSPPDVRITMIIFLPLVIYEAISAWYPSMFSSAKLLRAQESIDRVVHHHETTHRQSAHPQGFTVIAHQAQVSWGSGFMKPVSFSADRNSPLLIKGANGAGKSTLALGMCGLLNYQGSISLCNQEVATIENLEDFVSSSLQNSHIFNTSLRENLKIADQGASDEKLRSVLRLLELENIDLDDIVGEYGRNLSGGEVKRVSVARALLSPAPIVILDEPLEHLDNERAARLEKSILNACKNRTLVVIAHSGWKEMSNTLVLER